MFVLARAAVAQFILQDFYFSHELAEGRTAVLLYELFIDFEGASEL
jgi:hypothetical protein